MISLAEAAGYTIVGTIKQIRHADSSYQIGKGKATELAALVQDVKAEKLLFDNDLKPIQAYNIAKLTGIEAIDRFQLILEIFIKRASTREARLQIQLARVRHQLPRARESIRLARMGEQPGFLGLGKYEIDVYLESIKRQIVHLRKELQTIRKRRRLQRSQRLNSGFSIISLAGYTFAGKTSLFNILTKEAKPIDQGLFTTLSTTTRVAAFRKRKVLITDTVGFIDRIPLTLIDAFHSTLEETVLSDVIILVVDVAEPLNEVQRKLSCCIDTLNDIGAFGIPIVTALNKIDRLQDKEAQERITYLGSLAPNPVPISARASINIQQLKEKVEECLGDQIEASFMLPINNETASLISKLHRQAHVVNTNYSGDEVKITIQALPWYMNKVYGKITKNGGRLLKATQ
ncbi:MAG: GTPase HflX [Candidatus Bathyarchaeota archaeon]|nr:MAG: GTPase HflX [Candidatus Bathyarchaeota archaeon]